MIVVSVVAVVVAVVIMASIVAAIHHYYFRDYMRASHFVREMFFQMRLQDFVIDDLYKNYSMDEFADDLERVLAHPKPTLRSNAMQGGVHDVSRHWGKWRDRRGLVEDLYHGISSVKVNFFDDISIPFRDFHRVMLAFVAAAGKLDPDAFYDRREMKFESTVAQGILPSLAGGPCADFVHWGRPMLDVSGDVVVLPLPKNTPSASDMTLVDHIDLGNCVVCMMLWGWYTRNIMGVHGDLTAHNVGTGTVSGKFKNGAAGCLGDAMDIWVTGNMDDPWTENRKLFDTVAAFFVGAGFGADRALFELLGASCRKLTGGFAFGKTLNVPKDVFINNMKRARRPLVETTFEPNYSPDPNSRRPFRSFTVSL